jgi:hypothetical protein
MPGDERRSDAREAAPATTGGPSPPDGPGRRSEILEAISIGVREALGAIHRDDALGRLLEPVARAVGASRVYLFENHRAADGRLLTSRRYEWVD